MWADLVHKCVERGQEAPVCRGRGGQEAPSLVQACVDCVHTGVVGLRLGELEREKVGELGLPSF